MGLKGVILVVLAFYVVTGTCKLTFDGDLSNDGWNFGVANCTDEEYIQNNTCHRCKGYEQPCNDTHECCMDVNMLCSQTMKFCECLDGWEYSHSGRQCYSKKGMVFQMFASIAITIVSMGLLAVIVVKYGAKYTYPNKTCWERFQEKRRARRLQATSSQNQSSSTAALTQNTFPSPTSDIPSEVVSNLPPPYTIDPPPQYSDITDISNSPPPNYSTVIAGQSEVSIN